MRNSKWENAKIICVVPVFDVGLATALKISPQQKHTNFITLTFVYFLLFGQYILTNDAPPSENNKEKHMRRDVDEIGKTRSNETTLGRSAACTQRPTHQHRMSTQIWSAIFSFAGRKKDNNSNERQHQQSRDKNNCALSIYLFYRRLSFGNRLCVFVPNRRWNFRPAVSLCVISFLTQVTAKRKPAKKRIKVLAFILFWIVR